MADTRGFTLIEVLIVASITGLIASFLILSFSRTRGDIDRAASGIVADIRNAQTRAVASTPYGGLVRCGYGIKYVDATHFMLFAGPGDALIDCSTQNRLFGPEDTAIETVPLADPNVVFKDTFSEIFFEPPDPRTYLNGDNAPTAQPANIALVPASGSCTGTTCKSICVYRSGRIEIVPTSSNSCVGP